MEVQPIRVRLAGRNRKELFTATQAVIYSRWHIEVYIKELGYYVDDDEIITRKYHHEKADAMAFFKSEYENSHYYGIFVNL